MIDIIIGAFLGALAGALWVNRQCVKNDIANDDHLNEIEKRVVKLEAAIGCIDTGIQAALIQHGDIIKVITSHDHPTTKTARRITKKPSAQLRSRNR